MKEKTVAIVYVLKRPGFQIDLRFSYLKKTVVGKMNNFNDLKTGTFAYLIEKTCIIVKQIVFLNTEFIVSRLHERTPFRPTGLESFDALSVFREDIA